MVTVHAAKICTLSGWDETEKVGLQGINEAAPLPTGFVDQGSSTAENESD